MSYVARDNKITPETIEVAAASNPDAIALARSGKKEVLTRRFGFWSMTGFSCGLMCTWEGMLVAFTLGFANGGPAGLIYSFFIAWLGTISVFIVMGELASMIPTAGGQYHWVSLLAPESSQRVLSYVTGWITVVGWTVGTSAIAFFVSSLIQALMVLNLDNYDPVGWQGTLLFWGVLLISLVINVAFMNVLPAIEVAILVLHVVGFFAVLLPVVCLGPRSQPSAVFNTWQNAGGFSSQALSFFVGLNGNAIAFVGTDGPVHMSEEVRNAAKNVPRSMIYSTLLNGVLAFGILLAVLFHMGSMEDAMNNAPNGFPFIAIFASSVGSKAGATAMTSLIIVLELFCCVDSVAAASRMMWSFARDRGLPGHATLKKVDGRTTIPLAAVVVVFIGGLLIGLINIGSTTAFNAVVSMALEAFYSSYLLACGILLYRRIRGDIRDPDTEPTKERPYEWGPWRLKGLLGTLNNIVACAYLLLVIFFGYWPTMLPVTAANMNWSSTVLGSVAIFSMGYYLLRARNGYTGPVVEVRLVGYD
ncbi:amino acid transporter [Trematosphaeria pertusa]|uniref:Amino acid transporter n=1 Tax=Trematosphaeria pertusa TaxID=390896 RepID=A0A6A6HQR4_9PLEO|nr:amino acid transporter [Trematosphaeria pertusa]KAF2240361.1 amino acid transporter [Trematosphaeria pertusa]